MNERETPEVSSTQNNPQSSPNMGDSKPEGPLHFEDARPKHSDNDCASQATTDSPGDPRNWPRWKKNAQIIMIAFHSMVCTFMAAGIVPAFDTFAEEYGVTVTQASYLTSFQILLLGILPVFWKPITVKYGRYHVCLLSVLAALVCNIGGSQCRTYGSQMATRVLTSIFISPPIGFGSGVVTELCTLEERGRKLGWWALMITLGTPGGPFIMGFVVKHLGVDWIFWIFAILNFVQLLAYLALGSETVYLEDSDTRKAANSRHAWLPHRIDQSPFGAHDFFRPLSIARVPRVLVPALAHAIVFCYGNIALVVEMPISFGKKFNFDAQQTGLQFISIIIGCVLGEMLSGPMSNRFLRALERAKGRALPADRLWLSYIGFATVIAGLLTWGFQLQHATVWNVTPCVGAAIASFGNQIVMTVLISFAVDSRKERSADVGVFINVARHIWGFIGPFYFPSMFDTLNLSGAAGVMCAIIVVFALVPIMATHFVATR